MAIDILTHTKESADYRTPAKSKPWPLLVWPLALEPYTPNKAEYPRGCRKAKFREIDQKMKDSGYRSNYLWHDFGTLEMVTDRYLRILYTSNKLRYTTYHAPKTINNRLSAIKDLFQLAIDTQPLLDNVPEEERSILDAKLPRIWSGYQMYDLLAKSCRFFAQPNEANYRKVRDAQLPLSTLAYSVGLELGGVPDVMMQGDSAMAAKNGLVNTKYKAPGTKVALSLSIDHITVSNRSENPLPDNVAELGVRGKTGIDGSGFGVWAGSQLIALRGESMKIACDPIRNSPLYQVSVAIPLH